MAHPEYYIGLMSGTSLDGIDAALVSIDAIDDLEDKGRHAQTVRLCASQFLPFDKEVQTRLARLCDGNNISLLALGQASVELAELSAALVNRLLDETSVSRYDIQAIGCHGLTLAHHPDAPYPFSMQITDASRLAALTGIDVTCDFRMADIAARGQGAPLVPPFHRAILPSVIKNAAILNLGGIANVTLIQENQPLIGFDTGPANTLLNIWCETHTGQTYDKNGDWAASGQCHVELLDVMLADPYFSLPAPKSTGKETFNLGWLEAKLATISDTELPPNHVQCTLTHLVAKSVARALAASDQIERVFVCGGGVHNQYLMHCLQQAMSAKQVVSTLEIGICPDNMEAMAFAWLAWCRVHGEVGNCRSVTGAERGRVLGALYKK